VVEDVFMRLGEFSDNWGVVIDRNIADGDTVVADGKAASCLQNVDSAKVRELIR